MGGQPINWALPDVGAHIWTKRPRIRIFGPYFFFHGLFKVFSRSLHGQRDPVPCRVSDRSRKEAA